MCSTFKYYYIQIHKQAVEGQFDINSETYDLFTHQTFCSNLEELIQWLYTVVERMEVLEPPTVDIKSVKSSLANYKVIGAHTQTL